MDIDKKTLTYIHQAIRNVFTWSDYYKGHFSKGKTNKCEVCQKLFCKSNMEVHHGPEPVIPFDRFGYELSVQEYYDRVWELPVMILCKACHDEITKEQRVQRKEAKSLKESGKSTNKRSNRTKKT